ncbi:excalibur calcium-binding domain-containing protein [Saccharopolyspora sp. TS4A08]|uniref:Excalibur calcium-binding domain-containing protein n=1 Tax=Saccharopolyspora ipomoeae TaxID=3042027 RepID=A0ABT6PGP9_9PSEU|nr:excalibur calcium-binding domain-containing protein [Saccharopolyspora sp. TS4A08]MDI2027175.1 excalibur calcium-binding domain-containing protein [Saccharopolyspora sp. TS4A08]
MVFGIVYLVGMVATVVMSVLLWQQRARQGRAWPWVMAGVVAAVFWPLTLWPAVGAHWYRRGGSKRAPLIAGTSALAAVIALLAIGGLAEHDERAQPAGPQVLREPSSPPPSVATPSPVVAPAPPQDQALVLDVLDDDRVLIRVPGRDPQVVRLAGLQTPPAGECWGAEARAFAERSLRGVTVRAAFGVGWSSGRSPDPEVSLILPDGAEYSSLALQQGAAEFYPQSFLAEGLTAELVQAEATAKTAGRGLWGEGCHPPVQAAPVPAPAPVPGAGEVVLPAYYADCAQARAAGAAPLHRGDTGYSSKLDGDGDGAACE